MVSSVGGLRRSQASGVSLTNPRNPVRHNQESKKNDDVKTFISKLQEEKSQDFPTQKYIQNLSDLLKHDMIDLAFEMKNVLSQISQMPKKYENIWSQRYFFNNFLVLVKNFKSVKEETQQRENLSEDQKTTLHNIDIVFNELSDKFNIGNGDYIGYSDYLLAVAEELLNPGVYYNPIKLKKWQEQISENLKDLQISLSFYQSNNDAKKYYEKICNEINQTIIKLTSAYKSLDSIIKKELTSTHNDNSQEVSGEQNPQPEALHNDKSLEGAKQPVKTSQSSGDAQDNTAWSLNYTVLGAVACGLGAFFLANPANRLVYASIGCITGGLIGYFGTPYFLKLPLSG